jgi:hypothetical protein
MIVNWKFILPLLLLSGPLFSQVKTFEAVKVAQAPKIDGVLDDAAWTTVTPASGFIQNFPTYGIPASRETQVMIIYDNTSVYIGAYLKDDPKLIRRQITGRDGEQQTDADYFSVFFDTYNDHQNGFQFLVTSANVQTDARMGPNLGGGFGGFGDKTWDAVWESQVSIMSDGWVVEMRIPYISLRFGQKEVQDWGLQFLRFIRRENENSYWNPVDPQENGFINQFGIFKGLKNIEPPLRLSFSPYLSTGFRSTPRFNTYHNEWLRSGGMDVKYGINEAFTLDATLIPDFGQVVSDNVVNNLTPYEIRFQENRPFFTEGTELFNKAGLFYSRRIGDIPTGYYSVLDSGAIDPNIEIKKNPASTQLYNAIKLSGRTQKKLGIGLFNAVTAPMHAIIRDKTTSQQTRIRTETLANYNIIVLDQALKGRSYITFTNTNVIRNGQNRDANVSALDLALYNKTGAYLFQATTRYSKIWDSNPYDGYNTTVQFGKVSGNWQYSAQANVESAQYDPNDLGILSAPNEITYRTSLSYQQFKPTKNFITYSYSLDTRLQYLYEPYAFNRLDLTGTGFWVFKNFWDITLSTILSPGETHDYFELRTDGRYLSYPFNYVFTMSGSTDSRKKLFFRFGGAFARSPDFNNNYYGIDLGFRYRFNNRFSVDLQTNSKVENNQLGFAFEREMNGDPIVGFRDNKEFVSVITSTYNFTPRLNLSFRARHYWDKVHYLNFNDVDLNGDLVPRSFINGKDQNVNIFNLDAFITWDFRLGSRVVLGYKNWLGNDEMVTLTTGKNTYLRNLGNVFDLRHGNEITLRVIYFLDYNQLRKKK